MARTEKDFLNTLETYVKITQDRLGNGRIIDAYDELGLIEVMIDQRRQEVEGTAPWEQIREKALAEMMADPEEEPGARMLSELTKG